MGKRRFLLALAFASSSFSVRGTQNVMLTDVPDYTWHAGCFGTASGNLMGFWDRHGLPGFYNGPTAGGVAPLDSNGENVGIRSLWANRAGFDGRPANKFGHIDDYWNFYADELFYSYESTDPDPWVTAGRTEHEPDCVGDFIGASQNKWQNLNGECNGNIDAFSFTFWESGGNRRTNYVPKTATGEVIRDLPSGLRAWTQFRGYDAEVSSQLCDFNPHVPTGKGFTFADLKAEIDAGYPVMLFMQKPNEFFRDLPGMDQANPSVHGMLAFGYYVEDNGNGRVRYKTSWGGSGNNTLNIWGPQEWEAQLPIRGVITYHPSPKITSIKRNTGGTLTISWDGPSAEVLDIPTATKTQPHWYVLEKSSSLPGAKFESITEPATEREVTLHSPEDRTEFFRVRLVNPAAR